MNKYIVEIMTHEEYSKATCNQFAGISKHITQEANTRQAAYEWIRRKFPNHWVNPCVRTVEEVKAREKEIEEAIEQGKIKREKEKQKREEAKQRKIERDLAQGITPEMRKAMTYAKRYQNKIAELEKELEELKRKKAYWDKQARG